MFVIRRGLSDTIYAVLTSKEHKHQTQGINFLIQMEADSWLFNQIGLSDEQK